MALNDRSCATRNSTEWVRECSFEDAPVKPVPSREYTGRGGNEYVPGLLSSVVSIEYVDNGRKGNEALEWDLLLVGDAPGGDE